jgi:hypothetical protein
MRKGLLYLAVLFMSLTCAISSSAQLVLGDIAFTGYNSGTADDFSFVILKTGGIPAGTVIKFTDRGWWGTIAPNTTCGTNGWATTVEEEVVWTAAVAIPYGRQIKIAGLTASYAYGAPGTVTGVALSLSSLGDQIFAYQGTQTGAHTMIAGIHMNEEPGLTGATNWDNNTSTTTSPSGTQSNKPACIVNGTHGLFINPEVNNARIKNSVILSGNPATDRSRVNNAANWDVNDVTDFTLPGALRGLPVEFTYVKALQKNSGINVEWGIGTEEDIITYTVEKSDDGRLYMESGVLAASGKGTYNWTDLQPALGNNYYRIRATETNGTVKYSTIAVVNLTRGVKGVSVYPSVVKGNSFTLQLNSLPAGNYKLNLISTIGQTVFSRSVTHGGGSATQTVTLPASLQKGVYRINMTNGSVNSVTTIVVE